MHSLKDMKCQACCKDSPRITEEEIKELLPQLPEWALVERSGIQRLERAYGFENFVQALLFTNKVGELAEREGHHPAVLTEWGLENRPSGKCRLNYEQG